MEGAGCGRKFCFGADREAGASGGCDRKGTGKHTAGFFQQRREDCKILWDDEKAFLQGLLDSYDKGADPSQTVLVPETACWRTIADMSRYFLQEEQKKYEFGTIEL